MLSLHLILHHGITGQNLAIPVRGVARLKTRTTRWSIIDLDLGPGHNGMNIGYITIIFEVGQETGTGTIVQVQVIRSRTGVDTSIAGGIGAITR
jgi:hypothetical protein